MADSLERRLAAWERAGLVTPEQAARIARFEADAPETARDRRSGAAEAVGYVGAGLAFGALGLLLGEWWEEIVTAGRVALALAATLLASVAARALDGSPAEPMRRLTSVLRAAAVLGLGWLTYLITDEVFELAGIDVAAWVAGVAFVAALVVFRSRPRTLGQLVLLLAAIGVVAAALARPALAPEPLWVGAAYWGLGGVWLLLGLGGLLPPRRVAVVLGGATALVALQFAGFDEQRAAVLVFAVATGVVLVALAVAIRETPLLVVGALGIFVLVPQLTFELFGDAVGAPATLLITGVILVVGAVLLGRVRGTEGGSALQGPGGSGRGSDRRRLDDTEKSSS